MDNEVLIERLEAADGPDRELDAEIAHAAFTPEEAKAQGWCHSLVQLRNKLRVCPRFSSSIDAALTLVPDDRGSELLSEAIDYNGHRGWKDGQWCKGLAVCLCIAALRARGDQHEG